MITSRNPDDLPAFNRALLDVFSQAAKARGVDNVTIPERVNDGVDEAGEESFPASDPPAFNSGVSS